MPAGDYEMLFSFPRPRWDPPLTNERFAYMRTMTTQNSVSFPGAFTPNSAPPPTSPIDLSLEELEKAVASLSELRATLEGRLGPILLPSAVCPPVASGVATKERGSPMEERIESISNSVASFTREINGIISAIRL